MIPPEHNSSFVAHMERVLDVYKRPFDPLRPVVCMDESPKQLIAETRVPIPGLPGRVARHDYEYRRCGVCTVFLASEPLAGKRMVRITERRTKRYWAHFLEEIADQYESAEKITLVMDNLNTTCRDRCTRHLPRTRPRRYGIASISSTPRSTEAG